MRFLLPLFTCLLVGCQNPLATAWRSTATVRSAGLQVEAGLAQVTREKSKECLAKHGDKTPGYVTCIKPYHDAQADWITYGRPAFNTALVTTVKAIQTAELTKDKNVKWQAFLKPGLCALAVAMQQWGHLLPSHVRDLVGTVCGVVTAASCK